VRKQKQVQYSKALVFLGMLILILLISGGAFAQATHYCCYPDGCDDVYQPFNPCHEICYVTRVVECNGRMYTITCEGVARIWAIYPLPAGHEGCAESGWPIVLCAADDSEDNCEGGPPPEEICPAMMVVVWYDTGTC